MAVPLFLLLILTTCDEMLPGFKKVDVYSPELGIGNLSSPSGTFDTSSIPYLRGAITLSGTVSDDLRVAGVSAAYTSAGAGQLATAATVDGQNWSVTLPSGLAASDAAWPRSLPEGEQNVTITVTDGSGKTATAMVAFYVDNLAPTALATSPLTWGRYQPVFYRTIDLKGEVYDASPLQSVTVSLLDAAGSLMASGVADGTNTWSIRFNYSDIAASPLANNTAYQYRINVTDRAGNTNSWYYHRYDVYPLLDSSSGYVVFPSMDELGRLDQAGSGSLASGLSYAELAGIRLGDTAGEALPDFLFKTEDSPQVEWLNLSVAEGSDEAPAIGTGVPIVGTILPPSDGSSIDPDSVVLKILDLGSQAFVGTTVAGQDTPVQTSVTLTIVGSSLNFRLTPLGNDGSRLQTGHYVVQIGFGTNSGIVSSDSQAFDISGAAPSLTETGVGGADSPILHTSMTNTALTLSGTALNSNGSPATLVYSLNDGPAVELATDAAGAYSLAVPAPADHSNDGTHSYLLTASNSSGLQTVISRTILVDTTNPVLGVSSPGSGEWMDGNAAAATLRGTADDGSGTGVAAVYWLLAADATDHAGDTDFAAAGSAWTKATGTISWSGSLAPATLAEGSYVLWVKARDNAGNLATTNQGFGLDRAAPSLTESLLAGAADSASSNWSGAASAQFALGGVLADSNGLASLDIAQKAPGAGSFVSLAALAASLSGTSASWTSSVGSTPRLPWNSTAGAPWTAAEIEAGSADGTWTYQVTVTDRAGKTASLNRSVTMDNTPPTVTISLPRDLAVISEDSYTAAGTAHDSLSGVATVHAQVTSGTTLPSTDLGNGWTVLASGAAAAGATGSWTWDLDTASLGEGTRYLWTSAVDGAGNASSVTAGSARQFVIDRANPRASFDSPAGSGTLQTRTAVTFVGLADDAAWTAGRTATSASLAWSRNGGAAVAVNAGSGSNQFDWNQSTGTWSWTMPATLGDGLYVLTLTVTDSVGKTATASRTVQLDTTAPVLSVTTPAAGSLQDSASISLAGTAQDTGGVGFDGNNDVQYSLDSSDGSNGTWTSLSTSAASFLNWSSAGVALSSEGSKTIWFKATDLLGNSTSTSVNFTYDSAAPVLYETAVATSLSTRSNTNLAGTWSETNQLASLTISYVKDGAGATTSYANLSLPLSSGTTVNWLQPIDVDTDGAGADTGLDDGVYVFTITATDAAGKAASLKRTVTIDTTAPSLEVTNLADGATLSSSDYLIRGVANDTGSGLAANGIEYSLNGGAWTPVQTQGLSWSQPTGTLTEGVGKTIQFRARDAVGNVLTGSSIGFELDSYYPRADYSSSSGSFVAISGVDATNADFTLAGLADDASFTAGRQATSVVLSYSKDGGTASTATGLSFVTAAGTWSWTMAVDADGPDNLAGTADDHPNDGLYVFSLAVSDVAGKTTTITRTIRIDTTAPSLTIATPVANDLSSSSSYTVQGSVLDLGVGVAGTGVTYILAHNGSPDPAATADLSGTTWSKVLSFASQGTKTLAVSASDRLGNTVTASTVTFYYDSAKPALSETAVNTTDTVYRGDDFDLSGLWTETNSLRDIVITYQKDGGSDTPEVTLSLNAAGTNTAWSRTVAVDSDGAGPDTGIADGEYVFAITATDIANRSTTLVRTVRIDTTPPTITVPGSPASYVGSSVTLSGSATDPGTGASGILKVQYSLDWTNDANDANDTWLDADGTTSWSKTIDFAAADEGPVVVYFRSLDKGSRASPVGNTVVNVDHANPNADYSSSTGSFVAISGVDATNADFTLAGLADDASFSAGRQATAAVLSYSKDGGTASTATGLSFVPAAGTWSWTMAVDADGPDNLAGTADDHPNDGLYVFSLAVSDVAGKTTTITRTIRIDTTAPLLAINAPAPGESSTLPTYSISGTSRDTGGSGFDGSNDVQYSFTGLFADPEGDTDWTTMNSLAGTINWSAANVALGATEGSRILYVRSWDRVGNRADAQVSFYYDQSKPTFTETTVNTSDTQYRNADLVFGGAVSDTNTSAAPVISLTVNGSGAGTISYTGSTWTYTLDVDALAAGTYTLVFTATDAANKTTSQTRTVLVDKTAPSLSAITDLSAGWKTVASHAITGTAADPGGSGVASAEYLITTDGTTPLDSSSGTALAGTASFGGTVTFADGSNNRLFVRATDRAGNKSAWADHVQIVQVDTVDPGAAISSPAGTSLVNGALDLSVTVAATDQAGGSGAASVAASLTAEPWADLTSQAVSAGSASLTIPAATIAALAEGNQRIYFRTTDTAGRISPAATVNLLVDKTLPGGSVTSQTTPGVTVNKTISLAGTASDTNGLSATPGSLQVWRPDAPGTDTSDTSTAGTWENALSGSSSGSYNWTVSGFDTTAYSAASWDARNTAGFQLRLRLAIQDAAGNTGYLAHQITVDQHGDRPVIRLSNLASTDGSTTLKLTKTVLGLLSDDDGSLQLLEISETGSFSGTTSDDVGLEGGAFTYEASGDDGLKTLYFRLTDAQGTSFTTTLSAADDALTEPKVWLTSSTWTNTTVSYRVDTVTPEFAAASPILIDRSGTDFLDASDMGTNLAFGTGTGDFALLIRASDANGIASVKAALPGATGSPFTATAVDSNPVGTTTGVSALRTGARYRVVTSGDTDFTTLGAGASSPGTEFYASRDGTAGDGSGTVMLVMNAWKTGTINAIAGVTEGSATITITVKDNSDLGATATRQILVDKTAPAVSFINPASGTVLNGSVKVSGSASDAGSSIQSLQYKIGYDHAADPWQSFADLYSWTLDFTGTSLDESNPAALGNTDFYGNDVYHAVSNPGGESLDEGGGIYLVPILIKATDNAGNSTTTAVGDYFLRVDPSGDLPRAVVTYPYDPAKSVGGSIRVTGTASDDDGVAEVWMRIDVDNLNGFDAADTVTGDFDNNPVTPDSTVDWYNSGLGQQVTGSNNWYQNINTIGEFNPGSGTNTIKISLRVKDINGTWGPWTAAQDMIIDINVPSFNAINYEDSSLGQADKVYQPNLYLSGDWTLTGEISDETDISSIAVSGALTGNQGTSGWFTKKDDFAGGRKGYLMHIPFTTPAGSSGNHSITIKAYDTGATPNESTFTVTYFYDNRAPNTAFGAVVASGTGSSLSVTSLTANFGSTAVWNSILVGQTVVVNGQNRSISGKSGSYSSGTLSWTGDLANLDSKSYVVVRPVVPVINSDGIYKIQGVALDAGSDVDKVYVYFRRQGSTSRYYRPDLPVSNPAYRLDETGADSFTPSDGNPVAYPHDAAYLIKVDAKNEDGGQGTDDGDPYTEKLKQTLGNSYVWYADIDSTNIPDGPVEIHMVVFDTAGNSAHFQTDTFIQNNGPVWTGVILGTDLDGNTTVDPDEEVYYPVSGGTASTSFVMKSAPSAVTPVVSGGNGNLYYRLVSGGFSQQGLLRDGASTWPITLDASALGNIGDGSRSFSITVWDTTEETVNGTTDPNYSNPLLWNTASWTSLSAGASTSLEVKLADTVPPTAHILPFHWAGSGDNSLYNNSKANGHVEITSVQGNPGPDISGQISLRGTAWDDQRLTALWLHIDGFAFGNALASQTLFDTDADGARDDAVDGTYYQLASFASGSWTGTETGPDTGIWVTDKWSSDGWILTVSAVSLDQNGHLVRWQLDWDSSRITNVAVADADIRVIAEDKRNPVPNASAESATQTGSTAAVAAGSFVAGNTYVIASSGSTNFISLGAGANSINTVFRATGSGSGSGSAWLMSSLSPRYYVDVVPYISSMSRGAGYLTIRSREGRYVFTRGETVTLAGFNLYRAGNTNLSIGGSPASLGPSSLTSLTATISNTASSGTVSLDVSTIPAINNLTDNSLESNSEVSASLPGSALWNDDRKVHIWVSDNNQSTGNFGYISGSNTPIYPALTYNAGTLYASWSNLSASSSYYNSNNSTSRTQIYGSYDPMQQTDISYGSRLAVIYNADTYSNAGWSAGNAGGIQLWDGSLTGTNYYAGEELFHDSLLGQFSGQRIVTSGNYNFISYFDTETKALKYQSIPTGSGTGTELQTWVNIDGGSDMDDLNTTSSTVTYQSWTTARTVLTVNYTEGQAVTNGQTIMTLSGGVNITANATGTIGWIAPVGFNTLANNYTNNLARIITATSGTRVVSSANRSSAAGEYNAIALTPAGRPVIAYYDVSNQTVKIAKSTGTTDANTGNTTWSIQYAMDSGDGNYKYSGKYISMKIDGSGYLHMVFYNNSSGDLVYLKSTNAPTDGSTNYQFGDSQVIDSYGSVGSGADLTLNGTSAMVSYYDSSLADSFNGLKMAYEVSRSAGTLTVGQTYVITSLGTTNFTAIGADASPAVGESFVATGSGSGTGTVRDWEYMNCPLLYNVALDTSPRTSIEYNSGVTLAANAASTSNTMWSAALGYKSDDYYRLAYYTFGD